MPSHNLKIPSPANSKNRKGALALVALVSLFTFSAAAGDWLVHVQDVERQNAKIESLEKDIAELIERKRHLDDAHALKEVLADLVKKHQELVDIAAEREEELVHMRFKHPEKGDLAKREYARYEIKSLEQMESALGLDGKLDRIKAMIEAKYRVEARAKPARTLPLGLRAPASAGKERIVLSK